MKKVKAFLCALMVSAPALSSCADAATAAQEDYRGAYVTSPNIETPADANGLDTLADPSASGVFIRISWKVIEPAAKGFDWTAFDRVAVPAIRAGKKLSVGVIAGSDAPEWLGTQAKISYTDFPISQRGCSVARLYWPWDSRYQDAYVTMMRGLKAHLQAIGGYDHLKIVKISFIGQNTLELRLPRRSAGTYKGCTLPDATDLWIKAGYRPSRVLAGYRRVVGIMARDVFPGKILSQPTQRGDAFPDIGENGQRAPDGTADVPLVDAIVRACMTEAGQRCAIQNQSLQTVGPLGDRVLAARKDGAVIGWQTARNRGAHARCQRTEDDGPMLRAKRVPRIPCTSEGFARVLTRAIDAGATYLELWPADVQSFGTEVKMAEQQMMASK